MVNQVKVGSIIKIKCISSFNESFVKVGDCAEVIDMKASHPSIGVNLELSCESWEHSQYTGFYDQGYAWEVLSEP